MFNESRYLVTTSDERTWKFDQPIIFLGEWCRLYERKHVWETMDAIVAEPYGLDLGKKIEDNNEARRVEKILHSRLTKILNLEHNASYSERFWKILIGPWLRSYTEILINRVKTLEKCITDYQISGSTFIQINEQDLVAKDFDSFVSSLQDASFNSSLFLKILQLQGNISFPINVIKNSKQDTNLIKSDKSLVAKNTSPKKLRNHWIKKTLQYLVRDTDALITKTYLPRSSELKLQLSFFQIPQFWEIEKPLINKNVKLSLRRRLATSISDSSSNSYLLPLSFMLFNFLPLIYLEGFPQLREFSNKKKWPKFPRFIFTSNNFQSDEVFKLWTALKTETGIKYFVGQHGSNYGTGRFISPTVEEETSSVFFTWGSRKSSFNDRPAFNFKIAKKKLVLNPSGGLILLERPIDFAWGTFDSVAEHKNYLNDQFIFISNLPPLIKNKTTIRLAAASKSQKIREDLQWQEFDQTLRIDYGSTDLKSLLSCNRLIIFSYDSTGFLENLALNVPTMAFWQDGFDHLREDVKPDYQSLLDVGIIHLSPVSLATFVSEEWDNIVSWWNSSDVKMARLEFCSKYSRTSRKPIRELRKLILES
jgi:putative transferase (TIGR04331 family)